MAIHKKGKLDDVNDLRGFTLLSTLSKLFTRVLNNKLTTWAEEYYIYSEAQASVGRNTFLSSPHLWFIIVFICDLFVSRDDLLMS